MDEAKYIISTRMEKEDYRRFLYLAIFRGNKMTIPTVASIALAGSVLINWELHQLNWIAVAIFWLFFFVFAIAVVYFNVERKNKLWITSDQTGTLGSPDALKFYEDKVVIEKESHKFTAEMQYTKFFSVMESRNYFIFYFTANQASLIRKKDLDGLDSFQQFLMETFREKYKRM